MGGDGTDRWSELGDFIRGQRNIARLSLRRLSELAGVSNPYLSQIERGLRRPSADILQQIARALRISAETLYVHAGILDAPVGAPDLARSILGDPHLTEEQKQALVGIYLAFRHERPADGATTGSAPGPPDGQAAPDGQAVPDGQAAPGDRPTDDRPADDRPTGGAATDRAVPETR